ncbi:tRNA-yW synthesizing protein [Aureococcus anophagefferens]|uniref:tRNA-yW synthesizing protein n=1 Tax=Aureococcus anophagefferens TaxID=44056 RepID=A0ABR1G217_AURAN
MADDAATDDWEPVERRRRSTSAGSFDDLSEPEPELSRAARRNMERRRRRRAEKAAEEPAADAARAPTEADAERALRKVEKALRGIAALDARLEADERLTDEERAKLSRRDAAEAARAAWSALLLGFELKRQRADAIYAALENVRFEDAFECACCREVLELPVALPCRHEFCRACVAGVAKRAKRASDVKCPVCRAPFYDGAAKSCTVVVAAATRARLKKRAGTCHCGAKVPLSQLREHLRGCGDAGRYHSPREHLGHELCPPPDFSAAIAGGGESEEPSSPRDDDLQDALLRRFRVEPARRAPRPPRRGARGRRPRRRRRPARKRARLAAAERRRGARAAAAAAAGRARAGAPRRGQGRPPVRHGRSATATAARTPSSRARTTSGPSWPASSSPPDSPTTGVPLSAFLRGDKKPPAPTPAPWSASKAAASSSVRAIVADEKREAAKKKATWAGVAK